METHQLANESSSIGQRTEAAVRSRVQFLVGASFYRCRRFCMCGMHARFAREFASLFSSFLLPFCSLVCFAHEFSFFLFFLLCVRFASRSVGWRAARGIFFVALRLFCVVFGGMARPTFCVARRRFCSARFCTISESSVKDCNSGVMESSAIFESSNTSIFESGVTALGWAFERNRTDRFPRKFGS